jgi:hypothetical protein
MRPQLWRQVTRPSREWRAAGRLIRIHAPQEMWTRCGPSITGGATTRRPGAGSSDPWLPCPPVWRWRLSCSRRPGSSVARLSCGPAAGAQGSRG